MNQVSHRPGCGHRAVALVLAAMAMMSCSFDTSGLDPYARGIWGDATADRKTIQRDKPGPSGDKQEGSKPQDQGAADKGIDPPDGPTYLDQGVPCGGALYKCKNKTDSLICKNNQYVPFKTCPMDCNTSTGQCYGFDYSNGAGPHMGKTASPWTITTKVQIETNAGKITPAPPSGTVMVVTIDGKHQGLLVGSLTIEPSGELKVLGTRPLIIVASDTITIKGVVDVAADGPTPGPGGGQGGVAKMDGQGCGGGSKGTTGTLDPIGSGSGGSYAGIGGKGNQNAKPACAATCGTALTGGSGGGGGDDDGGRGGGGGGALQLTAWKEIVVSGSLRAGGGYGEGGKSPSCGGGGGGGSGGLLLLEAPVINLNKATLVANGGGGGGGGGLTGSGGNGQNGLASASSAAGGTGGGIVGGGGNGGGGASDSVLNGADGKAGSLSLGGGGGGAGRICIRSRSGMADGKGTLSPSLTPGLMFSTLVQK